MAAGAALAAWMAGAAASAQTAASSATATLADGPGAVIMHGQLFLAIPLAVLAGIISFASPCVLPVVPGYLGLVGSVAEGRGNAGSGSGSSSSAPVRPARSRVVLGAALFVLGFTLVFVLTGAAFGQLGAWLLQYQSTVMRVLGVVVILMGLVFLGQIGALQRERRSHRQPAGLLGAPLLGMIFAVGWAPCVGPTLIAINALGFDSGSAWRGALLAFCYCLGLGIPFMLVALGLGAATSGMAWLRRHVRTINLLGGALLIAIGVLMVAGVWHQLIASLGAILPGYVSPV